MGFNNVQQQLFRYFTLAKISTAKESLEAFGSIIEGLESEQECNSDELTRQIDSINKICKKYDLEILEGIDEITAEKIFVLVNTADNTVTQKAKFFDKSTVLLFSKIVQACIMSEKGNLSEINCINLNTLVEMSKTAAQAAIQKLVKDKWLESKDGIISLNMRSILELEQSIRQKYPEHVKTCPLCKTFLVQGSTCGECEQRIHFHCLKKYFKRDGKNQTCPSCEKPWKEMAYASTSAAHDDTMTESDNEESTLVETTIADTTMESLPAPTPAKRKRTTRTSSRN